MLNLKKKIIKKSAKDKSHTKVRGHCHYSGTYRGAAHSICNLRLNLTIKIPIVFNNGSNYDYYVPIKDLVKQS